MSEFVEKHRLAILIFLMTPSFISGFMGTYTQTIFLIDILTIGAFFLYEAAIKKEL